MRQRRLRVLAATMIAQILGDELAESEPFIQLANQKQATLEVNYDPWEPTVSKG
jgi:ribosome biogenesis protein Nip4